MPKTKWTPENTKKEFEQIYKIIGKVATQKEMDSYCPGLRHAVSNFYKGLSNLAAELGLKLNTTPRNYWKNFENVKKEILHVSVNHSMPSARMIKKNISTPCLKAVEKFGGMKKVAEKLGLKYNTKFKCSDGHIVDSGYEVIFDEFLSFHNISHEIQVKIPDSNYRTDFKIVDYDIWVEIWGHPKQDTNKRSLQYNKTRIKKENHYSEFGLNLLSIEYNIFEMNAKDLVFKFKELLKSKGIIFEIKNGAEDIIFTTAESCCKWNKCGTEFELNKTILNIGGYFPDPSDCSSSLYAAMTKHGGVSYWFDKMGVPRKKKESRWDNEEKIISEIKLVVNEIQDFPTSQKLISLNKSDLSSAISNNGGFYYYRKKMGFKENIKPANYWTIDITLNELFIVIEDLEYFPNADQLTMIGRADLVGAIKKNGGFNYFRKQTGFKESKKRKGYWTKENIIAELRNLTDEVSYFPNVKDFKILKRQDLIGAINKHGGLNYFRKFLGFAKSTKHRGYWNKTTILYEIQKITQLHTKGRFPTIKEMKNHCGGLINAIYRLGLKPADLKQKYLETKNQEQLCTQTS